MGAATGKVYAEYSVFYRVSNDAPLRHADVVLITDYTTFADIPKIIAIKAGVKPEDVQIQELYASHFLPE